MMKRYVLKTDHVKCFIMDEADEMLSRGFKDQIYEIFHSTIFFIHILQSTIT